MFSQMQLAAKKMVSVRRYGHLGDELLQKQLSCHNQRWFVMVDLVVQGLQGHSPVTSF